MASGSLPVAGGEPLKAMLLAAGRGERMGELTERCPKPLLPVAGKPLLRHHLEHLCAAGVDSVVVNVSYLADQMQNFLRQQTDLELDIAVSYEPERLETGGGIFQALPLLGPQPFLLVNSDVWCDFPLRALRLEEGALAHLVLVANPPHNPAGDFCLSGQQVQVRGEPCYTFSGISMLHPELFAHCEAGRFPLAPLLRQAMAAGRVSGELYTGYWVDVGTPQRLQDVESRLQERAQ